MQGIVFDPSNLIITAAQIMGVDEHDDDGFINTTVLISALINEIYADTSCILAQYTASVEYQIRSILIPMIKSELDEICSRHLAKCRIDFKSKHIALLYEYPRDILPLAEMLLNTIVDDLKEGIHQYPKHIIALLQKET